ncbi:hypothetical protein GCM10009785_13790 [Brooklawnia cerclae]|uniref:Uncharacterized protein n=1 Tax=Brooklawnia cerclae TaxID=349934 RepID=A0ABX0SNA0_9ACTN|nr:hypothetical protein [Brooklawnia cerclae]NIH58515.1 hypothetical protein [Brooklawnia cerclae]
MGGERPRAIVTALVGGDTKWLYEPVCESCSWCGPATYDERLAKENAAIHNTDRHPSSATS